MSEQDTPQGNSIEQTPGPARRLWAWILSATFLATVLTVWVLVVMVERKQEAKVPFVRLIEVNELSTDPVPWGVNWPHQFDAYKRAAGRDARGGSSALPESKLERQPWLRRLYAGYAFSLDYRDLRGHAYMLYDQRVTERVTQRAQAGACLHCHASVPVTYRRVGLEAMGRPADSESLAAAFDMPAVVRGFEELSRRPYAEVLAAVAMSPDGTPDENEPLFPTPSLYEHAAVAMPEGYDGPAEAHPVSCIDCHDPATMAIRVTRPGFVKAIAAFAEGEGDAAALPSVERWREGSRQRPYDSNRDASRQEMRSFVCGQCHVEYYCANRMVLTVPWKDGLTAEDAEGVWETTRFEDGSPFYDFEHSETGAPVFKAQHPEFELWSQGVHARSGVSCADCHMAYQRRGAMKVSDHEIRSPMENVNGACQTCHKVAESDLRDRVQRIQGRTVALTERAGLAVADMLDAIVEARVEELDEVSRDEIFALQRKAMWRLDYVSSENSRGFHADQEAARLLAESIDFSRKAQAAALRTLYQAR